MPTPAAKERKAQKRQEAAKKKHEELGTAFNPRPHRAANLAKKKEALEEEARKKAEAEEKKKWSDVWPHTPLRAFEVLSWVQENHGWWWDAKWLRAE